MSEKKKLTRTERKQIEAAIARANRTDKKEKSAQDSIPYQRMWPDGICRVTDTRYTKTIQYQDINYQLSQNEDKTAIFEAWCDFLNYFDSSVQFQLSFVNLSASQETFARSISIPPCGDEFDGIRAEYAGMLQNQLARGNNGLIKTKYLTFGVEADNLRAAKPRLERIETDLLNNFKRLGVVAAPLNGFERLHVMHDILRMDEQEPFRFSWDWLAPSGLSTKDFIAPSSFEFKTGRMFRMGKKLGAISFVQILAPELNDRMLADFLDMESSVLVNLHVQSVDQVNAIKTVKRKITDLDKSKIEEKAIEAIDGVKGQFFAAAQFQIILGTGFVDKVYAVVVRGNETLAGSSNKEAAYDEMTTVQKISRTFGDVFVPIIPVLVATGLFMGLRGMSQSLGLQFSDNVLKMSQILTDTAFAFLPALVAWSTMKKFGGTPVIGIVLGLMLVAPQLPNAYAIAGGEAQPIPMDILGITVPVVGYQGSVLPALVLGIFAAKLQQWFKSFVPDVVDLIVTPFLTLLISMLVGLLVVGPIMHTLEIAIFGAVRAFLELPFGIGGFIVGGLQQVIVVSGVHHVFNALEVQLLASTGRDAFNAIITGAIVAQGGAAVAVAAKTKNAKKRALYISSAIPAFLGITEPAIFGINLRFVKPFVYALVGGAFAGATASIMHLAGTGMGITVIPGTLLYLDHLVEYLIVNAIGFGIAFALTFTLFDPKE